MRSRVPTHYDGRVFRHILLTVTVLAAAPGAVSAGPIAQDFATLGSWQKGTRIGSMVQTPEGYVWLATSAGLLRFDGIRFGSFPHEALGPVFRDAFGDAMKSEEREK